MSDKETLKELIEHFNKREIISWVYEVEDFLKATNTMTSEMQSYIAEIKGVGAVFHYDENLLGLLKRLYREKFDCISVPPIEKRKQIFIAMKFSPETNTYYENAYKPIIQSMNYAVMRIDEKEYTGSIIGEIQLEITDSIALIADLTGNRGGVYYEAGIARGLQLCNHPIKLLLTCERTFFDSEKVHFDVSGDNILLYDSFDDLKGKLKTRLEAVLASEGKR